jgi:hypothetical protein
MSFNFRNMLEERDANGRELYAYARRFHPNSPECPSRLDSLNEQLRELIHDGFIAIRETNAGQLFEVWRVNDKYSIPLSAHRIYEWADPAFGNPLPPSPAMFEDLIVTKKSIWRTEQARQEARAKMHARWDAGKDAAKAALVHEATERMIEVATTPERAWSYEGCKP